MSTIHAEDVIPGSVASTDGTPKIVTAKSGNNVTSAASPAAPGGGESGQPLVASGNASAPSFGDSPGSNVTEPIVFDNTDTPRTTAGSYQQVACDLSLDTGAGRNAPDSSYQAPMMGNLHGDSLTKTGNVLGGVIGYDSVSGTQGTLYAKGGVIGGVSDGVAHSDGCVIAVLDGDSGAVTTPDAMFKARKLNSTPGNDPQYGLDLYSSVSGFAALAPTKAAIRMQNAVCVIVNAGVPSTTGTGFAAKGSLCVDITNGKLYINGGDATTPSWKLVTSA